MIGDGEEDAGPAEVAPARRNAKLARARRILESIADGVIVIASDGRIESVSAGLGQMFSGTGLDIHSLVGEFYLEVLDALPGALTRAAYDRVMDHREPAALKVYHEPWTVWLSVRAYPVKDGGAVITYQDITAEKRIEDAERDNAETLRRTFESIADGFITLDVQWRVTSANTAARMLFEAWGVNTDRMLGVPLVECLPEIAGSIFEKEARKTLVLRIPTRFEYHHKSQASWIGVQCYPIPGSGASLAFQDVTERKRAEHRTEELFRQRQSLLQSLDGDLQFVDVEWRLVASPTGFDASKGGATEADADSVTFWEAYPEVKGTEIEDVLCRAMYERRPSQFEQFRHGRWYLTVAKPVEGGGLLLHAIDMTERKIKEEAWRAGEARWRALADAAPQIIWIADGQTGGYRYINDQCTRYTGAPAEAFLGTGWSHFIHPDDREEVLGRWKTALAGGQDLDLDFRLRRYDGIYRWFKLRGEAVRDAASRIGEWYGTCVDIEDLVEARFRAEAADRAKSDFLANMSHEIRTPLTAIVGLTSIMVGYDSDPAAHRKYLLTLRDSASSLTELINDILEYAKIEADMMEIESEDFNMNALLDQVMRISAVRGSAKGLMMEIHSNIEPNANFRGDCPRIKQILLNLVGNAVKFTESGRVDLSASAEMDNEGRSVVRVRVRDTGIGIAPGKLQHIFAKFAQADGSISRRFGGTGLGLAISRRLSQAMGGTLEVESTLGVGSTFTLTLPLVRVERAKGLATVLAHTRGEGARILIVDDNAVNAMVAETMLAKLGYVCDVVEDGRQAINACRRTRYAAVLMDLQMPEMDGLQAARYIRQLEKTEKEPPVRIVAMTAHAMSEDRERCLAAGMDAYMTKPFEISDLAEKLATIDE